MKRFTTFPCFVRVEVAEERKRLIKWLEMIGRASEVYDECDKYVYALDCVDYSQTYTTYPDPLPGYIDCGHDVELFKALAAMNDEDDYMQWFTDGRDWRLCPDIVVTKMVIPSYSLYRKATAEEIIEHFKNK